MERLRARGDEVVGHGRTNSERQGDLSEDEERVLIREATDILIEKEGVQPGGWLGPWISETGATLDHLKEAGYRYVLDWPLDDQPVWMKTNFGPILSVPYPVELNDSPALLNRHHTPRQLTEMVTDQIDEMLEQCEREPLSTRSRYTPSSSASPTAWRSSAGSSDTSSSTRAPTASGSPAPAPSPTTSNRFPRARFRRRVGNDRS